MNQRPLRLSFTGGELSPWSTSRVDMDLYARSAMRIQNFTITSYGGLARRPGFKYINMTTTNNGEIRLIPFQYSTGDAYILELSIYKIHFYRKGEMIMEADGYTRYTVNTPWGHVNRLGYQQINDILYFCSYDRPPMRLMRYGDRNWVLEEIEWTNLPWRHTEIRSSFVTYSKTNSYQDGRPIYNLYNDNANWSGEYSGKTYMRVTTIAPDEIFTLYGQGLITSLKAMSKQSELTKSATIYEVGDKIYYIDKDNVIHFYYCTALYKGSANSRGTDDPANYTAFFEKGYPVRGPIDMYDKWEFRTEGTWKGEWHLRKSYDGGLTWITIRSFVSNNDANFITTGDESGDPCIIELFLVSSCQESQVKTVSIRKISHKVDHIFELVRTVIIGRAYAAKKMDDFEIMDYGSTKDWSLSAFGSFYGYPSLLTWHQNRLVFGATPSQPQTLWLSRTDDYHNFKLGSNDSDAMELTIAANSQNKIQWLHSQQRLFIGTSEGEWTLDSSDSKALSPSNARFVCHSHQGSEEFMPIPMESSLIFVQRGGLKIRELSYDINYDGFSTTDLTIMADHITQSGIKDICLFRSREQSLWIAKKNGDGASMTWIPGQNILAWDRQIPGSGKFISIATIHTDGQSQELWAIVRRSTAYGESRTIEMLDLGNILPSEEEEMTVDDMPVYLDSWLEGERNGLGYIAGMPQLADLDVVAYPVGKPHEARKFKMSGNMLNLNSVPGNWHDKWIVGIPYESLVTTTTFDYLETVGQLKNHVSTTINVLHSHPVFEYAPSTRGPWFESVPPVSYTESVSQEDEPVVYYSGNLTVNQAVFHNDVPRLTIRTDKPMPLNILSINPKLNFEQDQ